jgi:hypothetical protein
MKTFGFYNDTAPPVQSAWNPFGFISTGGFPPATLVQWKLNNSFGTTITFDSPVTEGNLIVVAYMGSGNTLGPTISDNLTNAYTLFNGQAVGVSNSKLYGYYAYNCYGGTCTISVSGGATANKVCFIAEYSGIINTSNPLIVGTGNKGGNSPLQNAITYSDECLIFNAWFNPLTNDKTGLVGGTSFINNDVGGASKFNSQQHLTKASLDLSPLNVGITNNTSAINVMVTGAFELGIKVPNSFEPETTAYMTTANIQNDSTLYWSSTIYQKTGSEWWSTLNNLVRRIKINYGLTLGVNNLSTQFKFIYPRLGIDALSYTINLVTGAVEGNFVGGWVIFGGGATPNGLNAYFQIPTKYNSTNFLQNDQSFGFLSKTNTDGLYSDFGAIVSSFAGVNMYTNLGGNLNTRLAVSGVNNTTAITNSLGFISMSRTSSAEYKHFRNGVSIGTITYPSDTMAPTGIDITEGANNNQGTIIQFSPRTRTIFYGGKGMTDAQMLSLNNAFQIFDTELNR